MKIKILEKSYDEVINMKREKHKRPKKNSLFWRVLMKVVSSFDLAGRNFKIEREGMERLNKGENALYLMNHSAFIDLEIVAATLFPRPFNIITTSDAFVGKNWLLHQIGCIPTKKFITNPSLLRDVLHCIKKLKTNVILFPEAGYSFDGTSTTLPDTLGKFVKMLGAPLVMIMANGAFLRDPLYNNLQVRDVDVSAKEKLLLTAEEVQNMTAEEIDEIIKAEFSFDNFRLQQENKIRISEPTRADFLNRVLYKCPYCLTEGKMHGEGVNITCSECGKAHTLTEYGFLEGVGCEAAFTHIPDWYRWERECVRAEIESGEYKTEDDVDIIMAIDNKRMFRVGEGRLTHDEAGYHLVGCDGKLVHEHRPLTSYSVCADFNWYEVGDIVCIGNNDALYYCIPKTKRDVVAKMRLATEEIYNIHKNDHRIKA